MKKDFLVFMLLLVLSGLGLSACQSASIEVTDAWARPGMSGENSAAYFVINNSSFTSDRLLSASASISRAVELHESMMSGEGMGETMQMVPQESVKIPALKKTEFKQGGLHVMFIDLQQDLSSGDTFTLTLQFEKAGSVELEVPVRMP